MAKKKQGVALDLQHLRLGETAVAATCGADKPKAKPHKQTHATTQAGAINSSAPKNTPDEKTRKRPPALVN